MAMLHCGRFFSPYPIFAIMYDTSQFRMLSLSLSTDLIHFIVACVFALNPSVSATISGDRSAQH